ncbi:alpha/beta hydrolase [Chondrinema litorale]|uniref:alpha/beta hydrolase n=1 Tax=Chondrinema litorale TaxID=2994555 RepID=UPI0025437B1C|nr:alpha/beta hydrolase [Chondrinema litorale]UZR96768.1 alpha/beta hydrolase [Chondrinema litorale]
MKKYSTFILIYFVILFCSCEELDPAEPGNIVPKTVIDDPSLTNLTLSGTTIHYASYGNPAGTKIFVLEGGPGDDFRYLLDLNQSVNGWSLLDDYQVIYHDYRGCGLSARHPKSELTMAYSLTDLEELIDYFSPDQEVILIGHSHGAVVTAQYINAHPNKVKGAVLMEPGAFSVNINEHLPAANDVNLLGKDINQILWIKQLIGLDDHEKADYYYGIARVNADSENRGETCPSKNFRGGAASAIAIAIEEVNDGDYDFTTKLSQYNQKVLFISSDESDLGYDFQQEYQVHLFPKYEHIKISGTGHNGLINCRTSETLGYIKQYIELL